jgi:hypothetical protein
MHNLSDLPKETPRQKPYKHQTNKPSGFVIAVAAYDPAL